MYGISNKSYNLMLKAFKDNKSIIRVILFGSRAIGNYKKGSDIDLIVEYKDGKNNSLATILNQELPIPYYFDIIDSKLIENNNLKQHVKDFGKVIYEYKQMQFTS
jgi:predicted nucleotidyltransferase